MSKLQIDYIKALMGFSGFGVWGLFAYMDASLRPEFLHFIIFVLGILTNSVLKGKNENV